MMNMKKDRLDELLKCALSGKDDARDAARLGLQRFRRRLVESAGKVTVLDTLLAKALAPADAVSPAAIVDAGLRSLRKSLERRPARRWAPILTPAVAFATIAAIAALLLIIQPFARFAPEETPKQTPGGFEGVLQTRNEIIANLPNTLAEPVVKKEPTKAITPERTKPGSHADAMDAFASKVRGESYAKRVTAHRREITASLMNDKDQW